MQKGSELVDAAMPRIFSVLPNPQEPTVEVFFKPDSKPYNDLRLRVLDLGWSLDALFQIQVDRIIVEQETAQA